MDHWVELVELYEYKVQDLMEGRAPRGGRRGLALLRDELLGAPLDPGLLRRLMETDRQYRLHQGNPVRQTRPRAGHGGQSTWEAPPTVDSDESRAWEELQLMQWHQRAAVESRNLTLRWQREPGFAHLRVLYTVIENAERLARPGTQPLAVPPAHDALMDLHDPEVTGRLASALSVLLLSDDGRARVRAAMSAVQAEPFPRHPDEDVLAARIAAAEREPLAHEAREALIRALRAEFPLPRDPRERPAIRAAARHVADHVEAILDVLPKPSLNGAPQGSILFAQHPGSAMRVPDDGAERLTVYLKGGSGARWRGLNLEWQPIGPNWQVQVGSQLTLLRPGLAPHERSQTLKLADQQFRAFVSGAYMTLVVESHTALELGRRASTARATALLLDPAQEYAYLRLARAAAQVLRGGPLNLEKLTPDSARKYQDSTPDVLLAFARKGVDTLCQRLARVSADDAALGFRTAAQALGLHRVVADRLHAALHIALHDPEVLPAGQAVTRLELSSGGGFASVVLTDEPLAIQVEGRGVTVRWDYKGELVVMMPGLAPMVLHDLLVARLPGGNLLLVRHGSWLSAALAPDVPVSTLEAADLSTEDIRITN
ncbi:hypothetical protein [Deinococcus radiotolerans]|uniref:DUF4132 domain-containing protein n=1 Tax=Deinococcus radiotolerans TaxID=1309407 RepID=A0ABQ2FD71_9DEIO|nr:hypothetical protein [Deinococcus radiotolerans]GGK86895.1 hypothetical protein GCM10010844_01750 [Deinococcus radiotolerans]